MNSKKLKKEGLVEVQKNPHYWNINKIYDSAEPPKISYTESLSILDNQEEWEKLTLGKKLNVAKVYSDEIADDLDIKEVGVHLARYKGIKKYYMIGNALSIKYGIAINMLQMKTANNVKNTITEEMRHIRQLYTIESEHTPKSTLPQEVIDELKNDVVKTSKGYKYIGKCDYEERPSEIDAENFVERYTKKTFGKYKASTPDNLYQKLNILILVRCFYLEVESNELINKSGVAKYGYCFLYDFSHFRRYYHDCVNNICN